MLEEAKNEAHRYKRYYFRHDYDEMIAEVLDKLDRFIKSNCIEIKDERGIKGYVTSGVHFAVAELKKKYTEENK
jgi:rRNA-processing protein FCF1